MRRTGFSRRVIEGELRSIERFAPPLSEAAYHTINGTIVREIIAPMQESFAADRTSSPSAIARRAFLGAPRALDESIGAGRAATARRLYFFGLVRGGLPRPASFSYNPFAATIFREVSAMFPGARVRTTFYLAGVLHSFVRSFLKSVLTAPALERDVLRGSPFPSVRDKVDVAKARARGSILSKFVTKVPPLTARDVQRAILQSRSLQDAFGVGRSADRLDARARSFAANLYLKNRRENMGNAAPSPPRSSSRSSPSPVVSPSSKKSASAKKMCLCPCKK